MRLSPEQINRLGAKIADDIEADRRKAELARMDKALIYDLTNKGAFNVLYVLPSTIASDSPNKRFCVFYADRPAERQEVGVIARLTGENPDKEKLWGQLTLSEKHAVYMETLERTQTTQIGTGTLWHSLSSQDFPNNFTTLNGFRISAYRI
jgi:hypothetical protein